MLGLSLVGRQHADELPTNLIHRTWLASGLLLKLIRGSAICDSAPISDGRKNGVEIVREFSDTATSTSRRGNRHLSQIVKNRDHVRFDPA